MTVKLLCCAVLLAASSAAPAFANGYGEDAPYQFRSSTERQVLLNQEQLRLQFKNENRGVGSQFGLGTQTGQTGNDLTITIDGNGDNTINVGQTNDGDQSAQHTEDGSQSSAFGAPSQLLNP